MCGRYVATTPSEVLAEYFEVEEVRSEPPPPSWNVAPTDPVPAVLVRKEHRLLGRLKWGLVPSWATDERGAAKAINARAETIASKPSFRSAFARRRCLLPADGFYEWERQPDGRKHPWFIRRADGAPLAMAGIWEVWRPSDASPDDTDLVRTCAVVTTNANSLVAPLHDRMPVLLQPQSWAGWLDPTNDDIGGLGALLVPADARLLERHRASDAVNSVRNNGPELLGDRTATGTVDPR